MYLMVLTQNNEGLLYSTMCTCRYRSFSSAAMPHAWVCLWSTGKATLPLVHNQAKKQNSVCKNGDHTVQELKRDEEEFCYSAGFSYLWPSLTLSSSGFITGHICPALDWVSANAWLTGHVSQKLTAYMQHVHWTSLSNMFDWTSQHYSNNNNNDVFSVGMAGTLAGE